MLLIVDIIYRMVTLKFWSPYGPIKMATFIFFALKFLLRNVDDDEIGIVAA